MVDFTSTYGMLGLTPPAGLDVAFLGWGAWTSGTMEMIPARDRQIVSAFMQCVPDKQKGPPSLTERRAWRDDRPKIRTRFGIPTASCAADTRDPCSEPAFHNSRWFLRSYKSRSFHG